MSRFVALFVPACVVLLGSGCAPGQSAIERSIRDEMKASLGVEVTSVKLTKQPDGSYTGTATVANGDTYDIETDRPSGPRMEWRRVPGKAVLERNVRDGLKQQMHSDVRTLTLNRTGFGTYSGSATLADGSQLNVTIKLEGNNVVWEAQPA
jgi:hypothetical protein